MHVFIEEGAASARTFYIYWSNTTPTNLVFSSDVFVAFFSIFHLGKSPLPIKDAKKIHTID